MRISSKRFALACAILSSIGSYSMAADKTPPKIYLDKSPRIVAYQLGRLDDDRLLMVPRSDDDPKYAPVYEAIVLRPAMAGGIRDEALHALAKIRDTSITTELITAIEAVKVNEADSLRLIGVLGKQLLQHGTDELAGQTKRLTELASATELSKASVGMAALLCADKTEIADELCAANQSSIIARLTSVAILPRDELKLAEREFAEAKLQDGSLEAQTAAISALSQIPTEHDATFRNLASLVANEDLRTAACRGLLRLPSQAYQSAPAKGAAETLVRFAESTKPDQRTSDAFIDSMRAAEQLLTAIPAEIAKPLRERLREVAVRVVRIGTVEEEMRYDVPYFAVEAGRPFQILLENHDLMPHNLVVTQPGALKSVAMAGLTAGPSGANGLPYVTDSPNVIAASSLVAPDASTRLTLTAPSEPGEYPYVCTFPQHWYRMYGVMIVVNDLDAWNRNPTKPANPLGSNRTFVNSWTLDDFSGAFENGLQGRSPAIGEKIFNEASCVGCHKVNESGGAVGPDLTDVYTRWKSDHQSVLREILEPSHKIDSKYATQTVLTTDGKTYSGIVLDDGDEILTLINSPDAKEPIVIRQEDIELIKRSATSMMPKALLDQYTKDEILELLTYLESAAKK
ncbi:c-type cytochrome [Rhodopirellula sp. MGV]|uniref:c-type cytochrome n=1 Tax=Rhodopirellula sp. MGV TaxID=2023130 RepID=UPI000B96CC73|nr:c-type cytochrome [Rhodopirellula sp. MGV]OYP30420.1 hypothetical protein CGZ80_22465 [Rhodopirellula sp. MGV]PNY35232.1 hypothetical protein C2E31_18985 [Rhodopirellula baltica]